MKAQPTLFLAERWLPVMSGSRLYHHEVARRLEGTVVVTRHERGGEADFDRSAGVQIVRRRGIGRAFPTSLPRSRAMSWLTEVLPSVLSMLFWSFVTAVRVRPAIVHAGDGFAAGTAARFVAGVLGIPYVVYAHGEDLAGFEARRPGYGRIMRRVFQGAGAVVCNTRNTANMAIRFGVRPERIVVAHPGVDTRRFETIGPASGAKPGGGPVLLSVGYLIRQKGHATVVRALPELVKAWPALRYVVVGDGPERGPLEALARQLGVADHVTFLGRVPEAELLEAYRAADVYVQPSVVVDGITEGYGISFVEAGAAGLPVVGGRCGGVGEAVADGVTGVLVEPGDVSAFTRTVSGLLADEALRRRMGEAGRRHAAERTWDETLAPVLAIDRTLRGRGILR